VRPEFWGAEKGGKIGAFIKERGALMKSQREEGQDKKRLQDAFEEMYEELYEWREKHPEASFDEIANQVTPRRRELMGKLLAQLALQHGSGVVVEGLVCEECGGPLEYKGDPQRDVEHLEGESELNRAYYHCPHCEGGVFPPGPQIGAGEA
jgi:hypothetical protein